MPVSAKCLAPANRICGGRLGIESMRLTKLSRLEESAAADMARLAGRGPNFTFERWLSAVCLRV